MTSGITSRRADELANIEERLIAWYGFGDSATALVASAVARMALDDGDIRPLALQLTGLGKGAAKAVVENPPVEDPESSVDRVYDALRNRATSMLSALEQDELAISIACLLRAGIEDRIQQSLLDHTVHRFRRWMGQEIHRQRSREMEHRALRDTFNRLRLPGFGLAERIFAMKPPPSDGIVVSRLGDAAPDAFSDAVESSRAAAASFGLRVALASLDRRILAEVEVSPNVAGLEKQLCANAPPRLELRRAPTAMQSDQRSRATTQPLSQPHRQLMASA